MTDPTEDPSGEDVSFHIGDSDLVLLGIAAVLTARHEMIRKRGDVGLSESSESDQHALELLHRGLLIGIGVPLDDVPKISMSIHGQRPTINEVRALGRGGDEGYRPDPARE